MYSLRNKKRLAALVLVFMLTFATGSAFAFTNGTLDIVGTVNVTPPQDLYVVWDTASFTPPQGLVSVNTAPVISPARGRTAQQITWEITFAPPAVAAGASIDPFSIPFPLPDNTVILHATARNNSQLFSADIAGATASWSNPGLAADLGLSFYIDDSMFTMFPLMPNGGTSTLPLEVAVAWNHLHTVPSTITGPQTLTLTVEFDYTPA